MQTEDEPEVRTRTLSEVHTLFCVLLKKVIEADEESSSSSSDEDSPSEEVTQ